MKTNPIIENCVIFGDYKNEFITKYHLIEIRHTGNKTIKSNFASRLYQLAKRRARRTNNIIIIVNPYNNKIIYINK